MNEEFDKKMMRNFVEDLINNEEQLDDIMKQVEHRLNQTAKELYVSQREEMEEIMIATLGLLEGKLPHLSYRIGKSSGDETIKVLKEMKLHLDVIKSLRDLYLVGDSDEA